MRIIVGRGGLMGDLEMTNALELEEPINLRTDGISSFQRDWSLCYSIKREGRWSYFNGQKLAYGELFTSLIKERGAWSPLFTLSLVKMNY
jgi:hypothetical protein